MEKDTEKVFFERQLVIFKLGSEEFGIDISDVREIIKLESVTKIPGTDSYVEGIINLRGGIVVIVNLIKKLELPSSNVSSHTRVIITEVAGSTVGFIVDSCSEVMRLTGDKIHPAPAIITSKIKSEYLQGVGILDQRLIIIIDLGHVIDTSDLAKLTGLTADGKGKRILLVEDSSLMRSTIKSFIPKNCSVTEAVDGETAVEIIGKEDFDIALLDIKLPGISGIDVLREIKKQKPKIVVAMETSVYDEATKKQCLDLGAKIYLKKPISKKDIEDVLSGL